MMITKVSENVRTITITLSPSDAESMYRQLHNAFEINGIVPQKNLLDFLGALAAVKSSRNFGGSD